MVEVGSSPTGSRLQGLDKDGRWGIKREIGLVQSPRDGVWVKLRQAQ